MDPAAAHSHPRSTLYTNMTAKHFKFYLQPQNFRFTAAVINIAHTFIFITVVVIILSQKKEGGIVAWSLIKVTPGAFN